MDSSSCARFTRGPWMAWDDGRTIGIEGPDGEPFAVAEIVDHGDMADPAQLLADQRLVSEAPSMCITLQRFIDWVDAGCDPSRKCIDEARIILARVYGEG